MIDQSAQLEDLPEYWQDRFRRLRSENNELRKRLSARPLLEAQGLPASWEKKVRKLREQNAKLRVERNAARAELEALRNV